MDDEEEEPEPPTEPDHDDEEWESDYFAEPTDNDRPGHLPKDELMLDDEAWDTKKPVVKKPVIRRPVIRRPVVRRPNVGRWSPARRPYYIPGHANGRRQPYRTLVAA